MEQFDSSEEESPRVLEQQQRNDEQQCPSCAGNKENSKTSRVAKTADILSGAIHKTSNYYYYADNG